MNKKLLKEHCELADKLEEQLEELDTTRKKERYEATWEAAVAVARAMAECYHPDAMCDVVSVFDGLLSAGLGCEVSVSATMYWSSRDEETGEELDRDSVEKWESADYVDIDFENANWTSPGCTKYETFAADVLGLIMGCFAKKPGPIPFFGESSTEVDGEMQFFRIEKGY